MSREVVVFGAGGHGAVVVSTAQATGLVVVGVLDDSSELTGSAVLGVPVVGPIGRGERTDGTEAVVGIGDNEARYEVVGRVPGAWAIVVHPAATIADSVAIAEGTVVFSRAVIQPRTTIGRHSIINTGAVVDHDCLIGDFVHVAPGATICGDVVVADSALVGAGATLTPGVKVGAHSIVGAGAVVVESVPDGTTVVGVPARSVGYP